MTNRVDTQAISARKRPPLQIVSGADTSSSSRRNQMMTVGNVKGGVGKTTLAVNLTISEALHGVDILLIDGD